MSKEAGFLQLRRGVWPHVRDGRLSHDDALVFAYIASQADSRTGVWMGSAGALTGELAYSPRNARRILERLDLDENGGYIKRFPIPGSHVCYPILIHKFLITDGEHKGEQLNAKDSTGPSDLRYFCGEQESGHKGEHKASQREVENREQRSKTNPAAKATPLSDSRYQPFFAFAFESFTAKHRRKPLWQGKDTKSLNSLLKNQSAESIPLGRLQANWRNFLDSTEVFTVKQGDSLAYFCANVDKFSDGPILAVRGTGRGTNGKPTVADVANKNWTGLGLDRPPN